MLVHNHRLLQHQVFINFRGNELRCGFVSHLVEALQRHEVNIFIDEFERKGEDLTNLLVRIEESNIALVIFSRRYTESVWCLDELVKINERCNQGLLKVIPIFFKVEPETVKQLRGVFGDQFRDRVSEYRCDKPRIKRWKEALVSLSCKIGLTFEKKDKESKFVRKIVKEVEKMLQPVDTPFRCMNILAYNPQTMELPRESFLVHENSKILNQIDVVYTNYINMECENTVLRAQHDELNKRLESLNSTIEMVEGVIRESPELIMMNLWNTTCFTANHGLC